MSPRPRKISGSHWIVEFYGVEHLDDRRHIRKALREAVSDSGARLLQLRLHDFGESQGVTGVALLAESHISIHTWPEREYAAIDIFMCGPTSSPAKALRTLRRLLEPGSVKVRRLSRGS